MSTHELAPRLVQFISLHNARHDGPQCGASFGRLGQTINKRFGVGLDRTLLITAHKLDGTELPASGQYVYNDVAQPREHPSHLIEGGKAHVSVSRSRIYE